MYAGSIMRSLQRRGLSRETAEDLTQETFLRVLVAAPRDQVQSYNPRAYLFQVARNLMIDVMRHDKAVQWSSLDGDTGPAIADPAPLTETIVYDRERLELVAATLAELPAPVRRAFELHRLQGMSLARVGQEMGISTTRSWELIQTAYRALRAALREA